MKNKKSTKNEKIKLGTLASRRSHTGTSDFDSDLYKTANMIKESRLIHLRSWSTDDPLKCILNSIKCSEFVIQQEIFFIGEMLTQAREILRGKGGSFSTWIKDNFDFGYDTARNFCNVYLACMGQFELCWYLKPSILYKISTKDFPKELRDFLIFNRLLENINLPELREIYSEYREKGIDAVTATLEEKMSIPLLKQNIIPYLDNLVKAIYLVKKKRAEMNQKQHKFEDISLRKGPTKAGDEIFFMISNAMEECIKILSTAKKETDEKINRLDSLVFEGFNEEISLYDFNYLTFENLRNFPGKFGLKRKRIRQSKDDPKPYVEYEYVPIEGDNRNKFHKRLTVKERPE